MIGIEVTESAILLSVMSLCFTSMCSILFLGGFCYNNMTIWVEVTQSIFIWRSAHLKVMNNENNLFIEHDFHTSDSFERKKNFSGDIWQFFFPIHRNSYYYYSTLPFAAFVWSSLTCSVLFWSNSYIFHSFFLFFKCFSSFYSIPSSFQTYILVKLMSLLLKIVSIEQTLYIH